VGFLIQKDVSEVRTASIITAMMEEVRASETSVCFYETTRLYIPESCHLHIRRREKKKSYLPQVCLRS
jgi:hypothetical protein